MKVAELEGDNLDKAVMRGHLLPLVGERMDAETAAKVYALVGSLMVDRAQFHPSRDWAQGGPIIEREKIAIVDADFEWDAVVRGLVGHEGIDGEAYGRGDTPLIAAMRAYVASKFGAEVSDAGSIPDPESN